MDLVLMLSSFFYFDIKLMILEKQEIKMSYGDEEL
jgi:hypothetical protein